MCDMTADELIERLRKSAANFKPADALKMNGMSWDYVTIALTADVSHEDRKFAVKFAKKALAAAAIFELGFFWTLRALFSRNRRIKPIEAMASVDGMPPEPEPVMREVFYVPGMEQPGAPPQMMPVTPMDEHRVRRRRAVTARVLLRLEKDLSWQPTRDEMDEIQRSVGARVHRAA
jgi:hypothetical protein